MVAVLAGAARLDAIVRAIHMFGEGAAHLLACVVVEAAIRKLVVAKPKGPFSSRRQHRIWLW
jgi:hypothetical protein